MQFNDDYATLGIAADATPADVKRAYRQQARKHHPDVSKEPDAEARFKDITEAGSLLDRAADFLAEPAVMDGCGKRCTRQLVPGGASRAVLESIALPVWMSQRCGRRRTPPP